MAFEGQIEPRISIRPRLIRHILLEHFLKAARTTLAADFAASLLVFTEHSSNHFIILTSIGNAFVFRLVNAAQHYDHVNCQQSE
jgi:hypothetical protein